MGLCKQLPGMRQGRDDTLCSSAWGRGWHLEALVSGMLWGAVLANWEV